MAKRAVLSLSLAVLAGIAGGGVGSAGRPDTAPAEARRETRLAPMAFLAGACWVAPFPDGKSTDRHCFEWIYAKHQLRDRHVVKGPPGSPGEYGGETIYFWDAATGRITYRYVDANGGHSDGYVIEREGALLFPEDRYVAGDGSRIEFVTEWRRLESGVYRMIAQQRIGDRLAPVLDLTFQRESTAFAEVGAP